MHAGKLVFAQLMEFAPWHTFRRLVMKYRGDFNVRTFSCLDQFLCMAFAQLTYRESLRDIETCLRTQATKLYHLGIRGNVSRSALVVGVARVLLFRITTSDRLGIADSSPMPRRAGSPRASSLARLDGRR